MPQAFKAYVADVELTWGYQVSVAGLSKSPPTFLYPPPTTILGALAEAIARSEGLGEASYVRLREALIEGLLAVSVRPLNYFPIRHKDVNRVLMVSKKTSKKLNKNVQYPHPLDIGGSFDAPSRGKTIVSTLTNESPKLRAVVIWKENPKISVGTRTVNLTSKHFWRIHRLGTKESVVSVSEVRELEGFQINYERAETKYSFPTMGVEEMRLLGEWVFEIYADPYSRDPPSRAYVLGKTLTYAVPFLRSAASPPRAGVKTSEYGVPIKIGDDVVMGLVKP